MKSEEPEEPQLPDWVKIYVEAEKEKAYNKGRADGFHFAVDRMRDKLNGIGYY